MGETMSSSATSSRKFWTAMAFLAPNILGVLAFVVFPLVFAVLLAFSNWDLRLIFHHQPPVFVGLGNFAMLFKRGDFVRYLGNTLYLMLAIPVSIGASLAAAIMLSKETRGGGGRVWLALILGAVLVASSALLAAIGLGGSAMLILLIGSAAAILLGGITGGSTIYRTLFYCPNFVAGVATYILWQKLYNPQTGPLNSALTPVMTTLTSAVRVMPPALVTAIGWLLLGLMLALLLWAADKLRCMCARRRTRHPLAVPAAGPAAFRPDRRAGLVDAPAAGGGAGRWHTTHHRRPGRRLRRTRQNPARRASSDLSGSALMLALVALTGALTLLGLAALFSYLPEMAAARAGSSPRSGWPATTGPNPR